MDHQSKPPLSPSVTPDSTQNSTQVETRIVTSGQTSDRASTFSTRRMPPLPLYLASQSPRRRELLAQIGITPVLLLPDTDEDVEALELAQPRESARDYVVRVTRAKAQAAASRWQRRSLPPGALLCADTTVTIDDQILGKPENAEDATRILRLLSGQTHQVLTAVTVSVGDPLLTTLALSVSNVRFSALDDLTIQQYIDSGEPFGKAGAYGIQGHAAAWIEHLDGSYSGVMGLPLFETAQLLRHAGLKD